MTQPDPTASVSTCPSCGAPLSAGAVSCPSCGARTSADAVTDTNPYAGTEQPPSYVAPTSYETPSYAAPSYETSAPLGQTLDASGYAPAYDPQASGYQTPGYAPSYPQPSYPAGYPAPYAMPPRTNTVAILALVLGIVTGLGGIICGHIALSQIKRTGEGGRGMAIAGLVIGYVFVGFWVLYFVIAIIVILFAASAASL